MNGRRFQAQTFRPQAMAILGELELDEKKNAHSSRSLCMSRTMPID
jgi:hypothetical protein